MLLFFSPRDTTLYLTFRFTYDYGRYFTSLFVSVCSRERESSAGHKSHITTKNEVKGKTNEKLISLQIRKFVVAFKRRLSLFIFFILIMAF